MVNGCNPIPLGGKVYKYGRGELQRHDIIPFYEQFQTLYKESTKQTAPQNLVFGLEVDYSSTDVGLGGFYNAGYVPVNLFSDLKGDYQKDFEFYWPREANGKFMRYQGSINLGCWPRVLHDALSIPRQWWENGMSYVCGTDISKVDASEFIENDIWMHLFATSSGDFETFSPDCHVRFTSEFNFNHIDERHKRIVDDVYGNKHFTNEQIKELIVKFQEENTKKCETFTSPSEFFTNIRPRFYWDGLLTTDKINDLYDDEKGIFTYGEGDCHVFGKPRSQQEERRYISPDQYNGLRALTPMFCFSDSEADMTHQFYADGVMMDSISHKRTYCKLDSSCT